MATKKNPVEKKEGKGQEGGDAPSPSPNMQPQADIGSMIIELAQLRALVKQQANEIEWLRSIVSKKKSR